MRFPYRLLNSRVTTIRESLPYRLLARTRGPAARFTAATGGVSSMAMGLLGERHGCVTSEGRCAGFHVSHGGTWSETRFQPVRFGNRDGQSKQMRRKRSRLARIDWCSGSLTMKQVAGKGAGYAFWTSVSPFGRVCPSGSQWIPSAFCDDFHSRCAPLAAVGTETRQLI